MKEPDLALRDQLCGEGVRMMGRMAHTIRSLRTWPIDSPAIRFGLNGVATAASNICTMAGEVSLVLAGDRVRVGDYPVSPPPGMLSALRELRDWLRERGITGFTLSGQPGPAEVRAALAVLRELEPGTPPDEEALNEPLVSAGVSSIRFVASRPTKSGLAGVDPDEDPSVSILRLYLRGLRGVARLNEQGSTPAIQLELTRLVQGIIDLLTDDARKALALLGARGAAPSSETHPLHRTILALVMGRRLGMQEKELLELGLCALTADHGIIHVPRAILDKAGSLTPEERTVMQRHPLETVRNLFGAGPLSPALRRRLLVAFELRQGFDRSGYPQPLLWPELHPFSRIICLVDAYEALRSVRPWRPARSAARTMEILGKGASRRYDPMLLEELSDMLKAYRFED